MASTDWLPTADGLLGPFAQNFSTKISAAPATYGLVAADATALATLLTAYVAALAVLADPATKTEVAVASKDTAKALLVADLRALGRRVQATPTVTPAQKTSLGLPVHRTNPAPIPAPVTHPILNLMYIGSRSHTVRIADEATPTKKAKPFGVTAAEVFVTTDPTPPANLEDWHYKGLATTSAFVVNYDAADVGKQATIVVRWVNRKGQTGPASDPVSGTVAS